MLPDPELFVSMYVRQEAVLSSQIEGTESSLDDVLTFELDPTTSPSPADVVEVENYVRAIYYGLDRIKVLPLSLRLIREIHGVLLEGVRGADKLPGEFRSSQNWIGPANATLDRATFVPPPAHEMWQSLDNFERFLHDDMFPPLIHAGIAHAQFETIHPFLDGNGRVGRLLITLLLCHRGVLRQPVLYLSLFLMRNRGEYYARLSGVHDRGDWEGWLAYFLHGIIATAQEAADTARAIVEFRAAHQMLVRDEGLARHGLRLLDLLFSRPVVNVRWVQEELDVTFPTASSLLARFEAVGILQETTGRKRNRRFRYSPYVEPLRVVSRESGARELDRQQPKADS